MRILRWGWKHFFDNLHKIWYYYKSKNYCTKSIDKSIFYL